MPDDRLNEAIEKLSPKAQLWFWDFVKHRDAQRAAITAGYATKAARQQGHRLFTDKRIQECLGMHANRMIITTDVTPDAVILELASIAFLDMSSAITVVDKHGNRGINFDLLNEDQLKCMSEVVTDTVDRFNKDGEIISTTIKRKVKMYDKMKALELLARHFGLLQERRDSDVDDLAKMVEEARQRRAAGIVDVSPAREENDE
jgi:phage terminase small subunit